MPNALFWGTAEGHSQLLGLKSMCQHSFVLFCCSKMCMMQMFTILIIFESAIQQLEVHSKQCITICFRNMFITPNKVV